MRSIGGALGLLSLTGALRCGTEREPARQITASPVSLTPTPVRVATPGPFPAPGPVLELVLAIPPGYRCDILTTDLRAPDSTMVVLRAAALTADGRRLELRSQSVTPCQEVVLEDRVPVESARVITAVELSATPGLRVTAMRWWSGTRTKATF